ncbi:hypothetical protein D3C73_1068330 [compost metagenome]
MANFDTDRFGSKNFNIRFLICQLTKLSSTFIQGILSRCSSTAISSCTQLFVKFNNYIFVRVISESFNPYTVNFTILNFSNIQINCYRNDQVWNCCIILHIRNSECVLLGFQTISKIYSDFSIFIILEFWFEVWITAAVDSGHVSNFAF